jgi:prepilin-type processing-associated H-X9-DG protein
MLALHNYSDIHDAFPPLYTVDANGKPLHSWRVLILPLMEQAALYSDIRLNEPWDSAYNKQFHDRMPAVFQCPANPKMGCCYSGIAGELFVPASRANLMTGNCLSAVIDGASNTLAIVEVQEPFNWMDPMADITLDELAKGINTGRVGSNHAGGCNVGFVDGTVRFFREAIDKAVLRAMGTIAGGESFML